MSLPDDVKKGINLFIIQVGHEGTNLGEKRLSLCFLTLISLPAVIWQHRNLSMFLSQSPDPR